MDKKAPANITNDDPALFIEHKWNNEYSFPENRSYVLIAYIAYGQGTAAIGGERMDAEAKDIFVILPGISATFTCKDREAENFGFEIHYILFEKEFLRGEWERYGDEFIELGPFFDGSSRRFIRVCDNDMSEIRNCIVRMTNEYYEDAPARNSALFGQMLSMLALIFRRYNVKKEQLFSKNTLVDQTIRQIQNTIYQNPKPSQIAAHRFVSLDHLGRVFKRETGMTITEYINNLRVEITKDILENTDRPIEHIPMIFNVRLKYLQQIFKRNTGLTMREYRSRYHYR